MKPPRLWKEPLVTALDAIGVPGAPIAKPADRASVAIASRYIRFSIGRCLPNNASTMVWFVPGAQDRQQERGHVVRIESAAYVSDTSSGPGGFVSLSMRHAVFDGRTALGARRAVFDGRTALSAHRDSAEAATRSRMHWK